MSRAETFPKPPRIAAAIVTYNHRDAVLSLLEYLDSRFIPAFVTENDCKDGTAEAIREQFPDVSLLESPANLGGCGGFNCAVLAALSSGCEYIAMLDDDVLPEDDCLERLADFLDRHGEYVLAAPAIYISSKPDTLQETGGGIDFRNPLPVQAWNRFAVNPELPEHLDIDYASACCLLVRAEAVRRVGVMDWNYFIFSDDVDFCIRLQRETGQKAVCLTTARAFHDFPWSKPFAPMRLYFFMRNGLYMLSKLRLGRRSMKTVQTAVMRILRRWFYSRAIGDDEIARTLADVFVDSWHGRYGRWRRPVQFGASRTRLDEKIFAERRISRVLLDITIEDFDRQAVDSIRACGGEHLRIDILCDAHRREVYRQKGWFAEIHGRTAGRLGPVLDYFRMKRHGYDLVVTDATMEPRRPSSLSGRYAAFFHNDALLDAASNGLWSCFSYLATTALGVGLSWLLFWRFLGRPRPGLPPQEAAPVLEMIGVDPAVGQPWARTWPVPFCRGGNPAPATSTPGEGSPAAVPAPVFAEGEESGGYLRWCRMRDEKAPLIYASAPPGPLFSILVPVCDPPATWLAECIDSVRGQSYGHWELILADDASAEGHVREILSRVADEETRIKVRFAETRQGISAATNLAAGEATGEYLLFLDHDDILDSYALTAFARALRREGAADIIYADEDRFDEERRRFYPGFKPAYSPDKLLATNYIHHPVLIRRTLFEQLGGLRSEFDGSQDYDLLLRATEKTGRVLHVADVLYHMRLHQGSLAAGPHSKPKAHERGRRAVEEALRRRGINARIEPLEEPGLHRVVRLLPEMPAVSVILVGEDGHGEKDLAEIWEDCQCLSVRSESDNLPRVLNETARRAKGEVLIFASSRIRPEPGWREALVPHILRPDIGLAGGKLSYPDNRLFSAGLVLGVAGGAGRWHHGCLSSDCGYGGWMMIDHEVSALPWQFLGIKRGLFEEAGGFAEDYCRRGFDIDLALRLTAEKPLRHLCVPAARARFADPVPDVSPEPWPENDLILFWRRWGKRIRQGDPCYNPHLTLLSEGVFFHDDWENDRRQSGYFTAFDSQTARLLGRKFPGLLQR